MVCRVDAKAHPVRIALCQTLVTLGCIDMILKQVNVDQPDIAVANVDIQRCKKKRNKNKNIGQS